MASLAIWKAARKPPSWIFSLEPPISLASSSAILVSSPILTGPGSTSRCTYRWTSVKMSCKLKPAAANKSQKCFEENQRSHLLKSSVSGCCCRLCWSPHSAPSWRCFRCLPSEDAQYIYIQCTENGNHIIYDHDTEIFSTSDTVSNAMAQDWRMLRTRRMSPRLRVMSAFFPSSVRFTPWLFYTNLVIRSWFVNIIDPPTSSFATCSSRGRICSSFRGPNLNLVHRDCRAGMILLK